MISPSFSWLLAAATANPLALPGASAPKPAGPQPVATFSPQLLQQLTAQTAHLTPVQQAVPWLAHLIAALFMLSAVALVVLLAFQTTKQEGLSGTIGGRVESAYRPRLGFDQQLARMTSFVAITFVITGVLVGITGT